MKKIWSYIAMIFAGFAAGLIAMYKIMGEQIQVNVRKIKNKGTSGDNSVIIPIDIQKPSNGQLSKRDARIEAKLKKQEERKAKKEAKK
jgi:hypothetical protein